MPDSELRTARLHCSGVQNQLMMSWEQGAESSVYTVLHYGTTQCSTVYNHYRWKQKVRRLPLGLRCRKSKGFCDTKLSVMIETGLITPSWHIVLRGTLLGSRAEHWSLASGRGWGLMGRHYTVNVSTQDQHSSPRISTQPAAAYSTFHTILAFTLLIQTLAHGVKWNLENAASETLEVK